MYIMLSIEATVYADSNDKYSSIFQISKTKKLRLLSDLKYRVKYLQVFGVWYQGSVCLPTIALKVSCLITDLVCREVKVFAMLERLHRM